MINDIQDIRYGLGTGRYMNEAAISQGIVMRLLNLLKWPTYDTRVVWPEYATEGRRVDYALCHPPTKPTVFIEVKQAGNDVDADRQLFEYAFHKGVPLAILTTGQEWHFFCRQVRGTILNAESISLISWNGILKKLRQDSSDIFNFNEFVVETLSSPLKMTIRASQRIEKLGELCQKLSAG